MTTRKPTHVFTCHIAYVPHIHDTTVVPNHAHSDGVFAHLRSHVLVYLDAQILQHQQTCRRTRIFVMTSSVTEC